MKWLLDNASWIFSGVGIVLFTGFGYLFKRFFSKEAQGQQQVAERGAVAIQAGRDAHVRQNNDQKTS